GWAEEAMEGLLGPNIDDPVSTTPNLYIQPGIFDYALGAGGEYSYENQFGAARPTSPIGLGIGSHSPAAAGAGNTTENFEVDYTGWLVFPSAGVYTLVLGRE